MLFVLEKNMQQLSYNEEINKELVKRGNFEELNIYIFIYIILLIILAYLQLT